MHLALTQYSDKAGLRKFGERREEAVTKELLQLHMEDAFAPQSADEMSVQQKKEALESLMFLKEKRDGRIKRRACSDERKQREGSDPQDATSPTTSLESVLMMSAINAFEV